MKHFKLLVSALMLISLFACSREQLDGDFFRFRERGVTGRIDPIIENDTVATRATVEPDNGWKYIFQIGDKINIWSETGTTLFYKVEKVYDDGHARFKGGGFDLTPGMTYYSSHPLIRAVEDDMESLTTTYEGQVQTANNEPKHVAEYTYTYASATCDEGGNTAFLYHHLSSFFRFNITVPKAMTLTELTVTSLTDNFFALNGKADVTTGAFTPADKGSVMTLALNNIELGGSDLELKAFMAIAPVAAGDYVIRVKDAAGKVYSSPVISRPAQAAGQFSRFRTAVYEGENPAVAMIGNVGYPSLAAAVADVPTDGTATTITLLENITESAMVVIGDGKSIVLDLGEKTLTGDIDQYDSDLTIQNGNVAGTVYVNGGTSETEDYNSFTLASNAVITSEYGIILYQSDNNKAYGSTININGTVNGVVWVMGNITEGNSVINVNSGATIKGILGVALNGKATLNVVSGATLEGSESGIEVRAGTLNVTGGNIKSTATAYTVNSAGSGTTTVGAAIAVAQHTTNLPTNVSITGTPTLTGIKTISVADPEGNNLNDVIVTVADGLLGETVVIPAGFKWVSNGTTSTLTPCTYVAQIGNVEYETLDAAIAAVPSSGTTTITLLNDVSSEWFVVSGGKDIILDLNGKTLTGSIDQYDSKLEVKNGTIAGAVYVNGGTSGTDYNTFTLDGNATITSAYGIILYQSDNNKAYGSTININGTVNGVVWVMGNITEGNSVINVNNGATIKGILGVALNGKATLNVVSGATLEGSESGIEVRAGTLNVTGGNIKSTATAYTVNSAGSGTTTVGAAIAVAQHTTNLTTNVSITGTPALTGIKTISVADPEGNNLNDVTVTVADGLLGESVVIPAGFKWVSDGSMSTLTPITNVAKIGDVEYETLQAALDAAHEMTGDVTITLIADVTGYSIVHQKAGLNVTIDGAQKTVDGQIIIDGDGRASGTETLTISNIKFQGDNTNFVAGTDAFVLVPSLKTAGTPYYNNKYNYAHNITVSNCSFTSTSSSLDIVAFKSTSGAGDYNTSIIGCTGTNLHSLAQFTGTTGGTITNNTVSSSESFVNVSGGTGTFAISGNTFTTSEGSAGYGIRENASSTAVLNLSDNNFTAFNSIKLGKSASATNGTINITSGTYNGTIVKDIAATATGKIVITGGSFDKNPSDYVAPGYMAVLGSDNRYTVKTIQTVINDAPNGSTITLAGDLLIDQPIVIGNGKNIVLDLNGNDIYNTTDIWSDDNWSLISVRGGNLTIKGNGVLRAKENDCYAIDIQDGGVLTINGGTYYGNISAIYALEGTAYVKDGEFYIQQLSPYSDARYLLNCYDSSYTADPKISNFIVSGGTFCNFNPGDNLAEGPNTNFLASGHTVSSTVQDGNTLYTVQ